MSKMKIAGTSRVGGKEWISGFPESQRICTLQGDSISPTYKPDSQLRKGVRAHRLIQFRPEKKTRLICFLDLSTTACGYVFLLFNFTGNA